MVFEKMAEIPAADKKIPTIGGGAEDIIGANKAKATRGRAEEILEGLKGKIVTIKKGPNINKKGEYTGKTVMEHHAEVRYEADIKALKEGNDVPLRKSLGRIIEKEDVINQVVNRLKKIVDGEATEDEGKSLGDIIKEVEKEEKLFFFEATIDHREMAIAKRELREGKPETFIKLLKRSYTGNGDNVFEKVVSGIGEAITGSYELLKDLTESDKEILLKYIKENPNALD